MKTTLLVLAICCLADPVWARLGENRAEIAHRYGQATQHQVSIDNAGETELGDLHEKNGLKIWVAYDDAGLAALILFAPVDAGRPFTETEVFRLMEASGSGQWTEDKKQPVEGIGLFHCENLKPDRFAIWCHKAGISNLKLIMTDFASRRLMERLRVQNDRLNGF